MNPDTGENIMLTLAILILVWLSICACYLAIVGYRRYLGG